MAASGDDAPLTTFSTEPDGDVEPTPDEGDPAFADE